MSATANATPATARPGAPAQAAPAQAVPTTPDREVPSVGPVLPRFGLVGAFAAIYGIWGATFLATRVAVRTVPPLLTIGVRCAGGALILGAWAMWRGDWVRPTAAQWRTAVLAGALLFLGCHAVAAWAEQEVTSGRAALYLTAIPLWTVALAAARARRRPSARVVAGLALGVAGVAVLTGGSTAVGVGAGVAASAGDVRHRSLALIGAACCWALGSLVARDGARPASAVQGTTMQLAGGAAVVLLGSLASGELAAWSPAALTGRAGGAAALALAFLVVCGTVLGFASYTWLMRVRSPATVGTYAFVNPVVAVALAWAVGDEAASARTALALALVLGAVLLTWERGPAARRRAE